MAGLRKLFSEIGVFFAMSALFISFPDVSQAQTTCGPVEGVTQAGLSTTATTATLQWTMHPNFTSVCAQQLVVCWLSAQPDSTTACQTLLPNATTYVMTGLQPCTSYTMRVTVKPPVGTSVTSTFTAITGADSASNVTVSWVSASSLRVSWQYPAPRLTCITRFLAAVCDNSSQELTACRRYPIPTVNNLSNYSVAAVDLEPCRVYHVRVVAQPTAVNAALLNSAEIPFYLDGVSVSVFNATEVGSSAMSVSWSLPQAAGANCQHSLTACALPMADGRVRCAASVSTPTTTVNITNLRPCTAYQLQLNLTTPGGQSVIVGPVLPTFSTDRRLVSSLQLSRTRDQIAARWTPVHADPPCAKGYRVCWNETTGVECEVFNTTTRSFTIVDLGSGAHVVEVAGIFFDDSLSPAVVQTARISGAASIFVSPIILVFAVLSGKALQAT